MPKNKITHLSYKDLFLEKIRENYQSLILGLLIFFVGLSVIVKLVSLPKQKPILSKKSAVTKQEKPQPLIKKHQVKEGETLWSIAEKYYGSGFNAFDIAKANNLKSPDLIEKNQSLIIPDVKPKNPTTGIIAEAKTEKVTLTQEKYIVKEGDYLWKIALEAYGDGYQWAKIASFNNITNPDFIFPGRILIIPR